MKKILSVLAAIALIACTGEKNNGEGGGNQNNQDELTVTGTASEVTDHSATLTGYANLPLEMGDAEVGIVYDTKQSFEDGRKVAATALDGNNKFTVTITGLEPSTTYYYKSYVQNGMAVKYGAVLSFTTKEPTVPAGAVDLGIVMTRKDGTTYNLYWAASNLSVNGLCANPEDYGDYYAWGETEPYYSSQDPLTWKTGKTGYDWESYKWCNGDYNKLTRYCPENKNDYWDGTGTPDNKTEFADYNYADDAARARLGGKWRMPTDGEWTALRDNCTWTWTTQNGVNGSLGTSKTNGKSIFLPATGGRTDARLTHTGSYGLYWSSSLLTDYPDDALRFHFYSDDVRRDYAGSRQFGHSVRPVYEGDDVGSGEPISDGLVNYYGCMMSSSTVSSTAHVDINIYGTNVLGQSTGYGISTLKKTWASAVCYVNGDSYSLDATDGASYTYSNYQYGTFYWTWAFKNTTVMSALMNASTANPVTIKMTDIKGNEYSFVYSEPQTTNRSFYKYSGKE